MERQLEPDSNDSQNPRLVVNAFTLPAEENAKLNDAKSAEESYTVATGIWNLIVNRDGEGLRQLLDNYRISIEELEQTSNEFKQVAPLPWNSRVEGFPRLFTAKSSMVGSNMYFHVKTSEKQAVPKGTTPLHYCVHRRDATCCQLLLAKCADLTLWDGNGKTAFTIARESNDKNIMACFKRDHINRQILLQEKSMLLADIKNRCSRETQLGQELSELRAELANSSKRMMAYQSQNAQMANKIQALTSRIDNNERVSKRSNEGEEKSWARERDRLLDELDDARLKQQNLTILLAETEEDKTKSQHELRRAQDEKKQWLSEDGPYARSQKECSVLKQKLLEMQRQVHKLEQNLMSERFMRQQSFNKPADETDIVKSSSMGRASFVFGYIFVLFRLILYCLLVFYGDDLCHER